MGNSECMGSCMKRHIEKNDNLGDFCYQVPSHHTLTGREKDDKNQTIVMEGIEKIYFDCMTTVSSSIITFVTGGSFMQWINSRKS
jgi:hypothetical protein